MPPSKRKISPEWLCALINYLLKESSISCVARKKPVKPLEITGTTYDNTINYVFNTTPTRIYYKYKRDNPHDFVARSTFFEYLPKNFSKSGRRTDVCDFCEAKPKLEEDIMNTYIKIQSLGTPETDAGCLELDDVEQNFDELKKTYADIEKHEEVRDHQRNQYNMECNLNDEASCVVVADYKENIRLGAGPTMTGGQFFNQQVISVLGFAVIYHKRGEKKIEYHNFFSSNLTHDSMYSGNCLLALFDDAKLSQFANLSIWTDGAAHFRSKEFLAFIGTDIRPKIRGSLRYNVFCEHHGKTLVDANFGNLSVLKHELENEATTKSIDDLVQRLIEREQERQLRHSSNIPNPRPCFNSATNVFSPFTFTSFNSSPINQNNLSPSPQNNPPPPPQNNSPPSEESYDHPNSKYFYKIYPVYQRTTRKYVKVDDMKCSLAFTFTKDYIFSNGTSPALAGDNTFLNKSFTMADKRGNKQAAAKTYYNPNRNVESLTERVRKSIRKKAASIRSNIIPNADGGV
ncbi:hypothetical protein FRX31_023920 [Thalictrum thalictroides]|uniref:Uncharacterized protein n=1 Tax=Thalictrum thalictroides TaxID=46969 RepID=A0A7J6VNM9_THATH|nr:hypothetical protein FRX31_023920 [Thalictrum thalictroides]